jgi:hypothetical protein
MFKKIVFSVVVLLIVGLAVAYFVRNMLVEKAVEAGSEYALGVEADLGSASLGIRGGSLELNQLAVSNPEGFTAENFLSLRRGIFDVDAGSVLDDEVRVDSFIIEGVTLHLEYRGRHSSPRTDRQKGKLQDSARPYQTAGYVFIGRIPEVPYRTDRFAGHKRHRLAQPAGTEK